MTVLATEATHDGAMEPSRDFLDALDAFIAYIARVEGFSPETVRAYEGHLEAYGRWCARESPHSWPRRMRTGTCVRQPVLFPSRLWFIR